jgi:hypothetical protein
MTASIAYNVADYINENTNFSAAASEILNNAALIQMYTSTTASGDTITISQLTAVYPSDTVTDVILKADKVYYSTGGKGNYTFKVLKNGAKESDVSPIDGIEGDVDSSTTAGGDVEFARSAVKAAPDVTRVGTKKALGRERRKS